MVPAFTAPQVVEHGSPSGVAVSSTLRNGSGLVFLCRSKRYHQTRTRLELSYLWANKRGPGQVDRFQGVRSRFEDRSEVRERPDRVTANESPVAG
jgi:hypothetical protein